jgi:hypothetical protein
MNYSDYFNQKAAQLNKSGHQGRNDWTVDEIQNEFSKQGLTPEAHYAKYGKKEGLLAPKPAAEIKPTEQKSSFSSDQYLQNKVNQLNKTGYQGKTWTAQDVQKSFAEQGFTPQSHFAMYGKKEGVDPYAGFGRENLNGVSTYSPYTRSLNPQTDTVRGQITGLLSKDSPYMQRARARGLSHANARGLLNSSMAGGAAHAAAIDAALPIAQQDAGTYAEQGFRNQDAANQSRAFNASAQNDWGLAQMDIGSRERMQQADIASREQIAQWDREVRENIAAIEMDAQTRAQFLESTNELMQQYQIQFQEIATNKDLSRDARDAAWRNLREMYDEQIKLSGDMMGVPLTKGDYDVNEGTASWNVGGDTASEGDQSANPPEGGQPPITSRDGNTPILAEEVGLIQQKPIPRDMRGYKSFGIDTLYAKENGSYPTLQDLGQTEPPQGESFGPWLQSRASRFWRYKNPEVAVASGGQPLRTGDLSGLERQVFDDIPGTIRAAYEKVRKEARNSGGY